MSLFGYDKHKNADAYAALREELFPYLEFIERSRAERSIAFDVILMSVKENVITINSLLRILFFVVKFLLKFLLSIDYQKRKSKVFFD